MTITLSADEITTLRAKEAEAQTGKIGYWEIYNWLGDALVMKGVAPTDATLLWLRGAAEANAGRGAMAALIREYTETQYVLRFGTSIPAGKMQEASNAVAQSLIDDLLGRKPGWLLGQVPQIALIAEADAAAVGDTLFGSKLGHDPLDTAFLQNSAWSGTLLFGLLRSDQSGRLMSTGTSNNVDTLNDWRECSLRLQSL